MDFYIKDIGDPNYQSSTVQANGEVEQLTQQIETILFTNRRDVLGSPGFGCNLEDMVYSMGMNDYQIRSTITDQIFAYCPLATKYNVNVDVNFFKGEVRDIAFIDITVNNKYLIQVNLR